MGERAVIKGKNSDLGIYMHWRSGYDTVVALLEYCRLKGYPSLEKDSYGLARLCQVIGNFFGGKDYIGVWNMSEHIDITPEYVCTRKLDNGIYEIEDWKIKKHWNPDLVVEEIHREGSLKELLICIDESMPETEQIGKEVIYAKEVDVSELRIGDKVYFQKYDGNYEKHKVVGFANDEEHGQIPYVDFMGLMGDYSWNGMNYITGKTVRKAI